MIPLSSDLKFLLQYGYTDQIWHFRTVVNAIKSSIPDQFLFSDVRFASSLTSSILSVVSAHAASSVNNMEKSVSGSWLISGSSIDVKSYISWACFFNPQRGIACFRPGTRYIVGTHDMWWIVVEIRRGKHDSTSWIDTQHTYILCNRFKK